MKRLLFSLVLLLIIALVAGCSIEKKSASRKAKGKELPKTNPNAEVETGFGSEGQILVTLIDTDKMVLIDMSKLEIGAVVDTGVAPRDVAFSPDGQNYYALMSTRPMPAEVPATPSEPPADLKDEGVEEVKPLPNPLNHNAIWTWRTSDHTVRGKSNIADEEKSECSSLSMIPNSNYQYITDSVNNVLLIRDPNGKQEDAARINVGEGPERTIVSPDSKYLITINSDLKGKSDKDTISIIYQLSLEEKSRLEIGSTPWDGCFNTQKELAYITVADSNEVKAVNYKEGKIEKSYPVGQSPRGIVMGSDGKTLYVASFNDNKIYPLDIETGQVGTPFDTGEGPSRLAIDKTGQLLFVLNSKGKSMTVINISQSKAVKTIQLNGSPSSIAILTGPPPADESQSAKRSPEEMKKLITPSSVTNAEAGKTDSGSGKQPTEGGK
jgi:DNA-binding beta-propeller fold protein YncE